MRDLERFPKIGSHLLCIIISAGVCSIWLTLESNIIYFYLFYLLGFTAHAKAEGP